jgi:tetratricopeptide (TPR) repeat protein
MSVLLWALAFAQDPEELIRRGWASIDQKKFEAAEFVFRAALKARPDHPEAHAGLGVAWARQGRYELALPHLHRARELRAAYEHLDLELGRALYFHARYPLARERLEAYRASHPESWQNYELLGLCYLALNEYDRCIEALSHPSLKAHPEHEPMYLYNMGVAHGRAGRRDRAALLLDEVARKYPDTAYGKDAKKLQAAPQPAPTSPWERKTSERMWYLAAGVQIGHDSNPLSIGEDVLLPARLDQKGNLMAQTYAGGGARIVDEKETLWSADLRYGATFYRELSSFNQDVLSVSTYAEHKFIEELTLFASASFQHLIVGNDEARDAWSFALGGSFAEASWTRTRLSLGRTFQNYFVGGLARAQDLDGWIDAVSIAQELAPEGARVFVSAGYSLSGQYTEGRDYDGQFHRFFAQAIFPFLLGFRGVAGLSYSTGDYFNANSRDPLGRERKDEAWAASFRMDRRAGHGLTFYFAVTTIGNQSNLDFFSYERTVFGAGLDFLY